MCHKHRNILCNYYLVSASSLYKSFVRLFLFFELLSSFIFELPLIVALWRFRIEPATGMYVVILSCSQCPTIKLNRVL
jgi:uncharacterized membrane protein